MSDTLDTSETWQIVDNLTTVDFYVKLTTATFDVPISCTHAKRRAVSKKDLLTHGDALLHKEALVWHLWPIDLGTVLPKKNDLVRVSATETWVVWQVDVQSLDQRFRCLCLRSTSDFVPPSPPPPPPPGGATTDQYWPHGYFA